MTQPWFVLSEQLHDADGEISTLQANYSWFRHDRLRPAKRVQESLTSDLPDPFHHLASGGLIAPSSSSRVSPAAICSASALALAARSSLGAQPATVRAPALRGASLYPGRSRTGPPAVIGPRIPE